MAHLRRGGIASTQYYADEEDNASKGPSWICETHRSQITQDAALNYYYDHPDELPDRHRVTDDYAEEEKEITMEWDQNIFQRGSQDRVPREEILSIAPDQLGPGDFPMSEEQQATLLGRQDSFLMGAAKKITLHMKKPFLIVALKLKPLRRSSRKRKRVDSETAS